MQTETASVQYSVRLADGQTFGPATIDVLERWASEGRVPRDAVLVGADGSEQPVMNHPGLAARVGAPPTVAGQQSRSSVVGEAPGLIPYTNPHALVGYYLGIVGLFPMIGLPLAIAALVLGILGLRAYNREPKKKGNVHAIVAIVLSSVSFLYNVPMVFFIVMGIVQ